MTASPTIKTPAMEVPLIRQPQAQVQGERLKKYLTRVCLNQVSVCVCVCVCVCAFDMVENKRVLCITSCSD